MPEKIGTDKMPALREISARYIVTHGSFPELFLRPSCFSSCGKQGLKQYWQPIMERNLRITRSHNVSSKSKRHGALQRFLREAVQCIRGNGGLSCHRCITKR